MSKSFGSGLRQGTVDRLKLACMQDGTIISDVAGLEKHEGTSEERLMELGLTHSDLLRLERHGFAVRGYLPRLVRSFGKVVNTGSQVRWVFVDRENKTDEKVDPSSV